MAAIALIGAAAAAKIVDGVITLSSQETERYVAKFSFSPHQVATVNGSFHTDRAEYFDGHPHELTLCFYSDTSWPKFVTALQKGSLCRERQALASQRFKIRPSLSAKDRGQGPRYDFDFKGKLSLPKKSSHYWYAMLMDCFLEEYDAHPPPMSYKITFLNGKSHLPADERWMPEINALVFIAMLIYGTIYGINLVHRWQAQQQGHLITLVFGGAYLLQTLSVLCELCHLRAFALDGKGLRWRHTWLALDFTAGVLQSSSELVISTLLIGLGFGWTLGIHAEEETNSQGVSGRLLSGLRRPAQLMDGLRSPSLCLLIGIGIAQLVLQFIGREFEEDFNNFHDHEHWPGLMLIGIRLGLCALFAFAMRRSLNAEKQEEVASFLRHLFIYGMIWFFCLPLLVLIAMALPPHRRHSIVAGGAILLQASALTLLSTLFLKRSHYYRISSLAHVGSVFESGFSSKRGKLAMD